MEFAYPLAGLVTLVTVLVFHWMGLNEARMRQKHECPPPANSGPDELMRYMRVRGNTMEGMLLFLPSLWLFAVVWGDMLAGLIGVLYPISRVIYAVTYYKAADKRTIGFVIGWLTFVALWLGSIIGLGMQAFGG